MEFTTCWSTCLRSAEMVLETLEKELARLVRAFITPVRLAEDVGAWEAVAKAADRLERPVASDWLSPGPPSRPFNCEKRSAMVSYCEAAPPADSISWLRNWLATRCTLAMSTPISWPFALSVC